MDDFKRTHVPAFGSWDCSDDLPFTQCFETARQGDLLRYAYSEDRDLYVAGDLYQNDVVTPTVIVVPRQKAKARYPHVKEAKREGWVAYDCEVKEPPSPLSVSPPPPAPVTARKAPKAVDEDLYRISPELLQAKSRNKKKGWGGFFSCCLMPTSYAS